MRTKNKNLSRLGIFLIVTAVISFIVFYISVMLSNRGYSYVDADTLELVQTQEIPMGSPTALIQTSEGELRAVLYPEYAPETVENFIALANSHFYDGTSFFEMKEQVYAAAGSGSRSGGAKPGSREGQEHIPRELHQNLWPFRGALCAMTTSAEGGVFDRFFKNQQYFTGSRFMLLGSVDFSDEEFVRQFRDASGSEELADAFVERGGVPNFSQQVAVFGQIYAGLDVLDAILSEKAETESNAAGFTPPVKDVTILSVTIGEYEEKDADLNELP